MTFNFSNFWVRLPCQERATQTRELLAWGYANFETDNVQPANQVLAKAKVCRLVKASEVQIGLT